MEPIDLIFFSVLVLSVATSMYVTGEFLYRLYRKGADPDVATFNDDAPAARGTMRRNLWAGTPALADVAQARHRRHHRSSGAPDLLNISGTGYAVMLLPVTQSDGLPDVVESRVFLN